MIPAVWFGIGFLLYVGFCILTFDVYSRKDEKTKIFVLFLIYFYYTLLAGYLINLVEQHVDFIERVVEVGIYALACAVMSFYYYRAVIAKKDEKRIEAYERYEQI